MELRLILPRRGSPYYSYGQEVVRKAGLGLSQVRMGQTCSTSTNRLVRTRMLGGVGGGASNGPAYPIGNSNHQKL